MQRRWFQIHLSTAIMLMIIAGVMLGLNLQRRSIARTEFVDDAECAGWPLPVMTFAKHVMAGEGRRKNGEWVKFFTVEHLDEPETHLKGFLLNTGITFAVMIVSAALSEALIRRREANVK